MLFNVGKICSIIDCFSTSENVFSMSGKCSSMAEIVFNVKKCYSLPENVFQCQKMFFKAEIVFQCQKKFFNVKSFFNVRKYSSVSEECSSM